MEVAPTIVRSLSELWASFGDDDTRSIAAAFALIACYDQEVSEAEVQRFAELVDEVRGHGALPEDHRPSDLDRLERDFTELTTALLTDFGAGRRQALEQARAYAWDERRKRLLVQAAQAAVVADGVLHEREEVALAELCRAIGLDPAEH